MEGSRSRWLRTCKRQMQALAEYKIFWGLRLYIEYVFQNNTLAQEKICLYFKTWSIINNYKKGYFAIASYFLFMKLLTVQNLFFFFFQITEEFPDAFWKFCSATSLAGAGTTIGSGISWLCDGFHRILKHHSIQP